MLEQRDLVQATTPAVSLSALLAHPEFQQGLEAAQTFFLEVYLPEPLTEEEMLEEVDMSLTSHALADDKRFILRAYSETGLKWLESRAKTQFRNRF